jgi:hypothetical protein
MTIPQHRHEHVVPVSENRRGDIDRLADRAFDGKPSAVDFGPDAFDDDAP